MSPTPPPLSQTAQRIRDQLLGCTFGHLRVFGAAAFRPRDQAWVLVSVWARDSRLGLVLVPAQRDGDAVVLQVHAPSGVQVGPGELTCAHAQRVRFGSLDAERAGDHVTLRRGDQHIGRPRSDAPALSLTL